MMPGVTEEDEEVLGDEDADDDESDDDKWEEVVDHFGPELPSPMSEDLSIHASTSSRIPIVALPGDEETSLGAQQTVEEADETVALGNDGKGVSSATLPLTEEVLAQKDAQDAEHDAVVEQKTEIS